MFTTVVFVVALASVVGLVDCSLQAVLIDSRQHFGDADLLQSQLQVVLEKSQTQLEARVKGSKYAFDTAAFAQRVHASHGIKDFNVLAKKSLSSLALVSALVKADPILGILARRTILAGFVLQWLLLGGKELAPETEESLGEVVRAMYSHHVDSVARRGITEYFHISKSGGTTFSMVARINRCDMPIGIGQLEALGDLPRWINGTAFEEVTGGATVMWSYYGRIGRQNAVRGCTKRYEYVKSLNFSYFSNEYTLHGGAAGVRKTHVCPQFVNVVTLRNPLDRFVSHLHYMLARIKKRLWKKGNSSSSEDIFHKVFCSGDGSVWWRVAPGVFDNYVTRSFLGEHGFSLPVGSLDEQNAAVAQKVLLQFDLVLDLAAGEEAADLVASQGLGWNVSFPQVHLRTSERSFGKLNYSSEECTNDEFLKTALPRQGPDMQLYKMGRAVSFLDRLFLEMARRLGLKPERTASHAIAAASGLGTSAKPGGSSNASANHNARPNYCGLLNSTGFRRGRGRTCNQTDPGQAPCAPGVSAPVSFANGAEDGQAPAPHEPDR